MCAETAQTCGTAPSRPSSRPKPRSLAPSPPATGRASRGCAAEANLARALTWWLPRYLVPSLQAARASRECAPRRHLRVQNPQATSRKCACRRPLSRSSFRTSCVCRLHLLRLTFRTSCAAPSLVRARVGKVSGRSGGAVTHRRFLFPRPRRCAEVANHRRCLLPRTQCAEAASPQRLLVELPSAPRRTRSQEPGVDGRCAGLLPALPKTPTSKIVLV